MLDLPPRGAGVNMRQCLKLIYRNADLCQRVLYIFVSMVHVQTEDFAGVNDQRNYACRNQDGYEERSNWIEACPTVKLNQEC